MKIKMILLDSYLMQVMEAKMILQDKYEQYSP
jgi:hypothetical protein